MEGAGMQQQTPNLAELREIEVKLRQALQFLELSLSAANAGAFRLELGRGREPLADEMTFTDVWFTSFEHFFLLSLSGTQTLLTLSYLPFLAQQSKRVLGFGSTEQVTLLEFVGQMAASDKKDFLDALERLRCGESTSIRMLIRLIRADGGEAPDATRCVDLTGDAICLPNKRRLVVAGLVTHATDRVEKEQQRIYALTEAAEGAKRRASTAERASKQCNEYVETICHEIRNPLQGTMGASTLLRDDLHSVEHEIARGAKGGGRHTATEGAAATTAAPSPTFDADSIASRALRSAFRNLDIIDECTRLEKEVADDVLDAARIREGRLSLRLEWFPLRRLFDSLVTMFSAVMHLRELHLDLFVPDAHVRADYVRLLQVCVNLVSNATKFTLSGGVISVQVSIADNSLLVVTIEDTGTGVSAEKLAGLFQSYSTTADAPAAGTQGGGSGLGLTIAKRLVDLMNGTLKLTSVPNRGTRVVLCVPIEVSPPETNISCATPTPPPISPHHRRSSPLLPAPKHVLVVDDNVLVRRILERVLENAGCSFSSAANGAEAVAQVQQSSARFDAILMDVRMPVLDGVEATRKIREIERREKRPPVWIVGLSGDLLPEQRESAIEAGMNVYLGKPYQRDHVLAALSCVGNAENAAVDDPKVSTAEEKPKG